MFVVIGLTGAPGEDAEDVEIGCVRGPFSNHAEAQEDADQRNREAETSTAECEAAQIAWHQRRGTLFGNKYPLSDEEGDVLGPYPPSRYGLYWQAAEVEKPELGKAG